MTCLHESGGRMVILRGSKGKEQDNEKAGKVTGAGLTDTSKTGYWSHWTCECGLGRRTDAAKTQRPQSSVRLTAQGREECREGRERRKQGDGLGKVLRELLAEQHCG